MERNLSSKSEGRKLGYSRVSTKDQNLDSQLDALRLAGCDVIFSEKESGARSDNRPEFRRMLEEAREGDTIIVQRLDRASRSLPDLIKLLEECKTRKIGFQSLSESIDTESAAGALIFHLLGAVAQFQRSLLKENQLRGIASAKQRGKHLGRPKKLTADQVAFVKDRLAHRIPIGEIASCLAVSRSLIRRIRISDPTIANV